jgi:hypothetical protein
VARKNIRAQRSAVAGNLDARTPLALELVTAFR